MLGRATGLLRPIRPAARQIQRRNGLEDPRRRFSGFTEDANLVAMGLAYTVQ